MSPKNPSVSLGMHLSLRLVVTVVLLAGAGALPAASQELGLSAVISHSGNVELPEPLGFGASVHFDLGAWVAGLSYLRYSDETRKNGIVCQVYSPRIGCRTEEVHTSARLGGLRGTIQRVLRVGDRIEFRAGGGLSFNQLVVTSQGVSGFRGDLHMPNTGQIGYLGVASLRVKPLPAVPLNLWAGTSGHWIEFKGCVDPTDKTSGYAPFCGWDRFTEIQVGLSVIVPRR